MTYRKRCRKHRGLSLLVLGSTATALQTPMTPLSGQINLARSIAKQMSAAAVSLSLISGGFAAFPSAAVADNELSALGAKGFDASLIDTTCLTNNCESAAKRCLDDGDCRKGMTCTAKCLGDNRCITGCFAKYGNDAMNELLECSVDANGCIKIAILPPGPDSPVEAPMPPIRPLDNFDPRSLQGSWYKVLGWNSLYDCFDQQKNTFTSVPDDPRALAVDVQFSMPRPARTAAEDRSSYALRLTEKLVFDDDDDDRRGRSDKSFAFQRSGDRRVSLRPVVAATTTHQEQGEGRHRHASSVGHMFGLTFWENWSVVAESQPKDPDEWKFVFYTGRTTQNTYRGAFVYSRTPQLKPETLDAVFAVARKAGWDPNAMCAVNNDNVDDDNQQQKTITQKTPEATLRAVQKGLFVGAATAAEDRFFDDDDDNDAADFRGQPLTSRQAGRPGALKNVQDFFGDVSDYLEDPHATSNWVFGQQRKVGDVIDANTGLGGGARR